MTLEDLSSKPPLRESIIVKEERIPSPVRRQSSPVRLGSQTSQPAKVTTQVVPPKASSKPRLSLVERQSLSNTKDNSRQRRISSLHKPLPQPSQPLPTPDIFRFPSESPPKQPSQHAPKVIERIPPRRDPAVEDKENTVPTWPSQGAAGRERRKTFNATMEKLAQMTREEMQGDGDWEAALASKRRRQSVAI